MFSYSKKYRTKKVRFSHREEIEPHEILLDSWAKRREQEYGLSEKKFEIPIFQRNLHFFFAFCLLIIIFLFFRTFQFQVVEGKKFSALSEENKFIVKSIQAERGVIYDQNLNQLVFNKPSFDLVVNVNDLSKDEIEKEQILRSVALIIQKDYSELKETIGSSQQSKIFVKENLDHQTLLLMETKINEFPGFEIENNTVRDYFKGEIFSSLIGYKRKNNEKIGLEKQYDEYLSDKPGELLIERDALGNPLSKQVASMPESGQSLVLWLDSELQEKIYEALKNSIKNTNADLGAAIALNPKTGGVLAMVSLPSFDNNLFSQEMSSEQWQAISKDASDPLFNRAMSGMGFPTGSTIKPLIGLAALEENIIKPETKLPGPLELCIKNPWFPDEEDCFSDWKYHGASDLRRAIAESVNPFFYQIGGGFENFKGLGARKIKEWLQKFNWGSLTGIDLPKEGEGVLPEIGSNWRVGDTYHFAIGQGAFSATPLQVATAFVAIANKGILYQPLVANKIIDLDKNPVKTIEPVVIRNIPAELANIEVVREGMRQAVTSPDGSSHVLSSLPVAVASKTGTAQTGKRDVKENKDYLDSWITVFAPYNDPEIVLTIMVGNVKEGQYAVLPVAKEILEWYFTRETSFDE